jgi:hypothetical protein
MRWLTFAACVVLVGSLIWLSWRGISPDGGVASAQKAASPAAPVGAAAAESKGTGSTVPSRTLAESASKIPAAASYRDWFRAQQLGASLSQASNSNDAREFGAALYAHLHYCSAVANASPSMSPDAVVDMLSSFAPVDSSGFVFSSRKERVSEVELARKRCFGDENALSHETSVALRQRLFDKTRDVEALVSKLESLPVFDFSTLNESERSLVFSQRSDVVFRMLNSYNERLADGVTEEKARQAQMLYLTPLTLCEMGNDCARGSIDFSSVCANFGACSGNTVQEALRALMGSSNAAIFAKLAEKARVASSRLSNP